MHKLSLLLSNLDDVDELASQFTKAVLPGCTIYLHGDLGVGKTTFVRAALTQLGYTDKVKSPTYTIIEPYRFDDLEINHFDLYRLSNSEELQYLGVDDYFNEKAINFIEWPEHGAKELSDPDLVFDYQYEGEARNLVIAAKSILGEKILEKLNAS